MKTQELKDFILHNPKIKAVLVKQNRVDLIYKGGQRDILTKAETQDLWSFIEGEQNEG